MEMIASDDPGNDPEFGRFVCVCVVCVVVLVQVLVSDHFYMVKVLELELQKYLFMCLEITFKLFSYPLV